jgi:hypothetical protein
MVSGLLACESTSSPVPVYERTVTPEMVTGAALAALQPDGRFSNQVPTTSAGQVSLGEARSQTPQFLRYAYRGFSPHYTGNFTDPNSLEFCGDAYYVHSQLATIPIDSASPEATTSFLRRFGPQWLIPMCGNAHEPLLTVQVAIDGNEIRFENNEPVEPYSAPVATAWSTQGVPLNWPDALTISAERAVRFAYETLGVRVAEVPQLYFRGVLLSDNRYVWSRLGSARSCHRWRVVLESEASIRGMSSLRIDTTNVVHVGAGTCSNDDVTPYIHLPFPEQPSFVLLDFLEDRVDPPEYWIVSVPLAAPILFEIGVRAP